MAPFTTFYHANTVRYPVIIVNHIELLYYTDINYTEQDMKRW